MWHVLSLRSTSSHFSPFFRPPSPPMIYIFRSGVFHFARLCWTIVISSTLFCIESKEWLENLHLFILYSIPHAFLFRCRFCLALHTHKKQIFVFGVSFFFCAVSRCTHIHGTEACKCSENPSSMLRHIRIRALLYSSNSSSSSS